MVFDHQQKGGDDVHVRSGDEPLDHKGIVHYHPVVVVVVVVVIVVVR